MTTSSHIPRDERTTSVSRARSLWRRVLLAAQRGSLLPNRVRLTLLRRAGVKLGTQAVVAHGVVFGGSDVVLGRHAFVNVCAFIDGSAPVRIGDYSRLGPFVRILTGTHAYRRSVIRRWPEDPTLPGGVVIERGCWLGINAIVLPGITIREGCIIAAGAVVIRDTEPNGLYAGNPAHRVKNLPTDEVFLDEGVVIVGPAGPPPSSSHY
jgi:maltose O-acetyltransferase